MRKIVLAATAALALAAGIAPSLANGPQGQSSSNVDSHCASILADQAGHSPNDITYCRTSRSEALFGGRISKAEKKRAKKRQNPVVTRIAPVIRDDGPTISLPG